MKTLSERERRQQQGRGGYRISKSWWVDVVVNDKREVEAKKDQQKRRKIV
jgi:hypothetical protein